MRRLLAALSLLLLSCSGALAGEHPTVVLLPLSPPDGLDGPILADAARDVIAEVLASGGTVTLVERERLDAVLAEQRLPAGPGGDAAVRVGKSLSATRAVRGVLARTDSGWRVTLEVLRVPEGTVLGTADATGAARDFATAAAKVGADARTLLAAGAPAAPTRDDPRAGASLHFLRGVGLLRAGLHADAVGEFLEARRRSARYAEASFWTARAFLESGRPAHALAEFRAFLASSPTGPLAEEAHRRLLEADAKATAEASARDAAREPSLAEVFLRRTSPEVRAVAVDRAIAKGRGGLEDLEAASEVSTDPAEALRLLMAIADLDPDRFLAWVARHVGFPFDEGVLARAKTLLTADRVERLARASLHSPLTAARVNSLLVLTSWTNTTEGRAAARKVALEAAASDDLDVAMNAVRSLAKDVEVLPAVAARIADESLDAAWRANLLDLVSARAASSASIRQTVLRWLDDEREVLRSEARLIASGQRSEVYGPEDRDGMEQLRKAAAVRAAEILRSHRFPADARGLAELVAKPPDPTLADELLGSKEPGERVAALHLLRWRPADAERVGFGHLADADDGVRAYAWYLIEATPTPAEAFPKVIVHWRRRIAEADVSGKPVPIGEVRQIQRVLGTLRMRARYGERPPPSPPETAGPDEWEAWAPPVNPLPNPVPDAPPSGGTPPAPAMDAGGPAMEGTPPAPVPSEPGTPWDVSPELRKCLESLGIRQADAPPQDKKYRGTPLEWRMTRGLALDTRQLGGLLRNYRLLPPRERDALHFLLGKARDPALAEDYVRLADTLEQGAPLKSLELWAVLADWLRGVRPSRSATPAPRALTADERKALESADVRFLAAGVAADVPDLRHDLWLGFEAPLKNFGEAVPRWLDRPEFGPYVETIRKRVHADLRDALVGAPRARPSVGAFLVVQFLGDARTVALVFECLSKWAEVAPRLRDSVASFGRNDLRALAGAFQGVLERGTGSDKQALARWVAKYRIHDDVPEARVVCDWANLLIDRADPDEETKNALRALAKAKPPREQGR